MAVLHTSNLQFVQFTHLLNWHAGKLTIGVSNGEEFVESFPDAGPARVDSLHLGGHAIAAAGSRCSRDGGSCLAVVWGKMFKLMVSWITLPGSCPVLLGSLTLRARLTDTACFPSLPALPACCLRIQSELGMPTFTTARTFLASRPMLAQEEATITLALRALTSRYDLYGMLKEPIPAWLSEQPHHPRLLLAAVAASHLDHRLPGESRPAEVVGLLTKPGSLKSRFTYSVSSITIGSSTYEGDQSLLCKDDDVRLGGVAQDWEDEAELCVDVPERCAILKCPLLDVNISHPIERAFFVVLLCW